MQDTWSPVNYSRLSLEQFSSQIPISPTFPGMPCSSTEVICPVVSSTCDSRPVVWSAVTADQETEKTADSDAPGAVGVHGKWDFQCQTREVPRKLGRAGRLEPHFLFESDTQLNCISHPPEVGCEHRTQLSLINGLRAAVTEPFQAWPKENLFQ